MRPRFREALHCALERAPEENKHVRPGARGTARRKKHVRKSSARVSARCGCWQLEPAGPSRGDSRRQLHCALKSAVTPAHPGRGKALGTGRAACPPPWFPPLEPPFRGAPRARNPQGGKPIPQPPLHGRCPWVGWVPGGLRVAQGPRATDVTPCARVALRAKKNSGPVRPSGAPLEQLPREEQPTGRVGGLFVIPALCRPLRGPCSPLS